MDNAVARQSYTGIKCLAREDNNINEVHVPGGIKCLALGGIKCLAPPYTCI